MTDYEYNIIHTLDEHGLISRVKFERNYYEGREVFLKPFVGDQRFEIFDHGKMSCFFCNKNNHDELLCISSEKDKRKIYELLGIKTRDCNEMEAIRNCNELHAFYVQKGEDPLDSGFDFVDLEVLTSVLESVVFPFYSSLSYSEIYENLCMIDINEERVELEVRELEEKTFGHKINNRQKVIEAAVNIFHDIKSVAKEMQDGPNKFFIDVHEDQFVVFNNEIKFIDPFFYVQTN